MPAEKADALILRTVDFSESSLVVTALTREFGKIAALAKGGRRIKGPFESALDLLARCRIVFLRKSSGSLDLLTEAKLTRRFRPVGRDLLSWYAGYYVAELLGELTHDYDPHPELFDLADETLAALAEGGVVPRLIVRFELITLKLVGHLPSLGACAECTSVVPMTGWVAFGQLDGGVLCSRCRKGKRQVVSVNAGSLRAMAELAERDHDAARRIQIGSANLGEIRGVLNQYLSHLLGKKPKMHRYLGMLWNQ